VSVWAGVAAFGVGGLVGMTIAVVFLRQPDDGRAAQAARRIVGDELARIAGCLATCLKTDPAQARLLVGRADVVPPLPGWRDNAALLSRDLETGVWQQVSVVFAQWTLFYGTLSGSGSDTSEWPVELRKGMLSLREEALEARRHLHTPA
jgi:hypothetical protein